ncbi:MAG TPA: DEAD/DEAH box helicase [Pseudobacteroides sp.]|uniref:DEAD/DEAH box helicase n=1 Tax=Pseudobacteroides sp. TaxID=1968840 RepID=UPI002F93B1A3
MDKYGVQNTHIALVNKLQDYIRSQYLGENELLLNACEKLLQEKGNLYQEPYIEANPAYKIAANGIINSSLPIHIKEFLLEMGRNKLGVFESPYKHQLDALEAFYRGDDLLITTGTGSGKTECFMWPMITSIAEEAKRRPNMWKIRGVRALLLYPMNALVSDQLGRLRRMIGDQNGNFRKVFREYSFDNNSRSPQFGMYTGRTPYPGPLDSDKSKKLADTMRNDILNREPELISDLIKIGRYPSKVDFLSYVDALEMGIHTTQPDDAELITRQEMQNLCPDILVTNYSMLEYMLIRPIEQNIWNRTRQWLNASEENKLLIVIDEAHMYRGAAGGEVALLLRRLMYKLKISREKVRFILTSASIPNKTQDEKDTIQRFACGLTAGDRFKSNFNIITGTPEEINFEVGKELSAKSISFLSIDAFQSDEKAKINEVRIFSKAIGQTGCNINSIQEMEIWLFENLSKLTPVLRILKQCRGNATELNTLAEVAFPHDDTITALSATQVLLAVMPLAKSKEGQVLFPARLHMLFRGLQGLYACSNPNCPNKSDGDGITLGKIYFDSGKEICDCGGKVYELINDRRCGALFFKSYMDYDASMEKYLWKTPGEIFDGTLKEVHFYIVPKGLKISANKNVRIGWLDSKTGMAYFNSRYEGEDGFIKIAHSTTEQKNRPNILTYSSCPKCSKRLVFYNLSDFSTKGNEPFYNLISEQLKIQPPTLFDERKLRNQPNAGRKVLLFSDSRQKAAVLAKDMTRAGDDAAAMQAIAMAAANLQKWSIDRDDIVTINMLYPAFLEIAYKNRLQFFYGDDKEAFKQDLEKIAEIIERDKKRGKSINYYKLANNTFTTQPGLFKEQIIKLTCFYNRSLLGLGLCWIEPSDYEDVENAIYDLKTAKIKMSKGEFLCIFTSWAQYICFRDYAIGETIPDEVRENITRRGSRFGMENDAKMPAFISEIMRSQGYSDHMIEKVFGILSSFLRQRESGDAKYLVLNKICLKFNEDHIWYRCSKCSGIFPYSIWGHCSHCGCNDIYEMAEKDFERYRFWRDPIFNAIHGIGDIRTINTEEHTAQLSHKDQRENT